MRRQVRRIGALCLDSTATHGRSGGRIGIAATAQDAAFWYSPGPQLPAMVQPGSQQ